MSFLPNILILFLVLMINDGNTSTITTESKATTTTTTQTIYQKIAAEILKLGDDLKRDEEQLTTDRENFEEEKKQIQILINKTNVIQLNVGGESIMTTLETLTRIPKSILSMMFNGRWEHKLQTDQNGNIFLDFNPIVFRHLLDQLQTLDTNNSIDLYPPSDLSLLIPFKKMIRKLGLNQFLLSEKTIIHFNVGGQITTNQRTIFTQISHSTLKNIISSSKSKRIDDKNDAFIDYDPKFFRYLINQLREESFTNISNLEALSNEEKFFFEKMLNDLGICRELLYSADININTKWRQDGITIAGGNGQGKQLNQLSNPHGIYVDDDDQCIYIADYENHRIVQWKCGEKDGQVIAGGIGQGNQTDQLNHPTDIIVDKRNNSLIICDQGNRRVVRWSRQNGLNEETIISDIDCYGLATDNNGNLYVSDRENDQVIRWETEDTNGTIVAGGNGKGNELNQLNSPTYIFINEEHSVYVSDSNNHRVMKWMKDEEEGIIVAGGQGEGDSLTQLFHPHGVILDHLGNVYVTDSFNDRIMRWLKESEEGSIVLGENGAGEQPNQFDYLEDLSFDRQGNLYVVDYLNNRVQKFHIDSS